MEEDLLVLYSSKLWCISVGRRSEQRDQEAHRENYEPDRVWVVEPEIEHRDQRQNERQPVQHDDVAPQVTLVAEVS